MERKSGNQQNGKSVDMQLLMWPSSLIDSGQTNDGASAGGFILGWPFREGLTPQWPASTIVAAGIEWVPGDSSVQKEHRALQRRVEALQGNDYCSCPYHRQIDYYQDIQVLEGLTIVAYFSRRGTTTNATEKWLEKMSLPHLRSYNGYPRWGKADDQEQVLVYDPQNVYRHTLSGVESSFGKVLAQVSCARSIMGHLAKIQSSSASTTPSSETRPKVKSTVKSNAQNYVFPEAQQQSVKLNGGLMRFLERHSMLACHFRSMKTKRKDYTKQSKNDQCNHCQRPILDPTTPQEDTASHFIGNVIDTATGVWLGMLLVGCWSWGGETLSSVVHYYLIKQQFLQEWLTWLESFPIGFKLNVSLTQSIGQEIRSLVTLRRNILDTIALRATALFLGPLHPHAQLGIQCVLVLASVLLGGSGSLALLVDMLRLLTVHLALLSEGFRYVYSCELYLLGSMWRLFRGKKQNILRHRTDTMEYDSMQLLLGSILFVVTLFLLTTILVYYAFFTLLNLVVRTGASVGLWILYVLLQDFPFETCYLRSIHPELFTSEVLIQEELLGAASSKILITRLKPLPESFGSILASTPELRRRAGAFKSWLGASFSGIFSGKPTSKTLVECLESSS